MPVWVGLSLLPEDGGWKRSVLIFTKDMDDGQVANCEWFQIGYFYISHWWSQKKGAIVGNLSSHWLGTAFCSSEWPDILKLPYMVQYFLCITSAFTLSNLATQKTDDLGLSKILEHSTITWCTKLSVDHYLMTCIHLSTNERLCLSLL
jgi:hypothetical protein